MLGPNNYLARGYEAVPIAITVEGANILTRNLIIFGQGAIRCHPFVLREMDAARDDGPRAQGSSSSIARCSGTSASRSRNAVRSLVMALTLARFTRRAGRRRRRERYYQHINRFSASFALRHRRRDAHARRLPQEEGEPVGAARRRALATCTSRRWCSSTTRTRASRPRTCRSSSGRAARCSTRRRSSCTASCATSRTAGSPAIMRLLHLPARPHLSRAAGPARREIAELIMNTEHAARAPVRMACIARIEPGNPLGLLQEALVLAERPSRWRSACASKA